MSRLLPCLLIVGILVSPAVPTVFADEAKEKAVQKDRDRLQGRWRAVEVVVNGKEAEAQDAQKISVINEADGSWRLIRRGKGGSKGTSTIDPMATPKTIDFTITEGEGKGSQYLGIYELGEDTRKLVFAPADKGRPTEFASKPGNGQVLVKFERADAQVRDGEQPKNDAASADKNVLTNRDLLDANETVTAVDDYSDNEFLYEEELKKAIEKVSELAEHPVSVLVEVTQVGKDYVTVTFFPEMIKRVYPQVRIVGDGDTNVEFRSSWYGELEFGGIIKGGSRDGQLKVGKLVPTSLARELRKGDQLTISGTLAEVTSASVAHQSQPDVVAGFVIVASGVERATQDDSEGNGADAE